MARMGVLRKCAACCVHHPPSLPAGVLSATGVAAAGSWYFRYVHCQLWHARLSLSRQRKKERKQASKKGHAAIVTCLCWVWVRCCCCCYSAPVQPDSRSRMNVPFRICTDGAGNEVRTSKQCRPLALLSCMFLCTQLPCHRLGTPHNALRYPCTHAHPPIHVYLPGALHPRTFAGLGKTVFRGSNSCASAATQRPPVRTRRFCFTHTEPIYYPLVTLHVAGVPSSMQPV